MLIGSSSAACSAARAGEPLAGSPRGLSRESRGGPRRKLARL